MTTIPSGPSSNTLRTRSDTNSRPRTPGSWPDATSSGTKLCPPNSPAGAFLCLCAGRYAGLYRKTGNRQETNSCTDRHLRTFGPPGSPRAIQRAHGRLAGSAVMASSDGDVHLSRTLRTRLPRRWPVQGVVSLPTCQLGSAPSSPLWASVVPVALWTVLEAFLACADGVA